MKAVKRSRGCRLMHRVFACGGTGAGAGSAELHIFYKNRNPLSAF